jgi:hypothetical protein
MYASLLTKAPMVQIRFRKWSVVVLIALMNIACAAPGALQITPCEITLGRGQVHIVRAVDADGVTPPHVAWKSENPAIAEIVATDDEVRIHARSAGRTCISASHLLEVATTCVTVLDTASVPAGRVRWAVAGAAVLPSAQIADVIPARRDDAPQSVAMFVVEIDWGIDRPDHAQRVTIRGLDADGLEQWRRHIEGVVYEMSIPDPHGGVILVLDAPNRTTVRRLDGTDGTESWRYDSRGEVPSRCPQCPSAHGIRPDGTLFLVEQVKLPKAPWIAAVDLIGLDSTTGKVTSRLPLPISKVTTSESTWFNEPEISPMVIEDDGTAAVAIGTKSTDAVHKRARAELKLLRISPSGAATWQTIREHEHDGDYTHEYNPRALTPNGQGALLVSWFERDPGLGHALATRTHVSEWEIDLIFSAIDSQGDGYGVNADGDVVRVDVTTGRQVGAAMPVGKGATVLSGRPEGGVVVRDGAGDVRHYDSDGRLLSKLPTHSDGQHPWRLATIGKDFVETEGANVFAFRIEDD